MNTGLDRAQALAALRKYNSEPFHLLHAQIGRAHV